MPHIGGGTGGPVAPPLFRLGAWPLGLYFSDPPVLKYDGKRYPSSGLAVKCLK